MWKHERYEALDACLKLNAGYVSIPFTASMFKEFTTDQVLRRAAHLGVKDMDIGVITPRSMSKAVRAEKYARAVEMINSGIRPSAAARAVGLGRWQMPTIGKFENPSAGGRLNKKD